MGKALDYDFLIWRERKRTWFGAPWTFTVYGLSEDRLFVKQGLIFTTEREVNLYRVLDYSLVQNIIQRIFKQGSIRVICDDKDTPVLLIKNVRNFRNVKEKLAELVEKERTRLGIRAGEFLN